MFPLLHWTKAEQLETTRTRNTFSQSSRAIIIYWNISNEHSTLRHRCMNVIFHYKENWHFCVKYHSIWYNQDSVQMSLRILSWIECFQNKYLTVRDDWIQQLLFIFLKFVIARVLESIAKKEISKSWVKVCSIPCKRKEVVEQEKAAGNVLMTWTRHGEDGDRITFREMELV